MKLAALCYPKGFYADDLLFALLTHLQKEGVRVAGALQRWLPIADDPCAMELILLPNGARLPLSQALGRHAIACRLNPAAIAEASAHIRCTLDADPQPDLVLVSKFGELEAQGRGFRDEIALAIERGLPVLTAVAEPWLPAWRDFAQGYAEELPPTLPALLTWCRKSGVLR